MAEVATGRGRAEVRDAFAMGGDHVDDGPEGNEGRVGAQPLPALPGGGSRVEESMGGATAGGSSWAIAAITSTSRQEDRQAVQQRES